MSKPKVTIYTDGACSGNPGAGGYAAILMASGKEREIVGGDSNTTNNRMELMAAIEGLAALKKPCCVELYSDSAYIVNAFEKGWLAKWQANGWKSSSGKVKNIDLWQKLISLTDIHDVRFVWVKGHADNEYNNRCDRLAVAQVDNHR